MRLKTVHISNRTKFFWKRVPEPWRCYHKSSITLMECDKDSDFFGPSKTKRVIILLSVHVNVLNLLLL